MSNVFKPIRTYTFLTLWIDFCGRAKALSRSGAPQTVSRRNLSMKITLVYIAGKYRAPTHWEVEENIQTARKWGAEVIKKLGKKGYYPVIPHANTAHFGGLMPDKYFLKGTLEQLKTCQYIFPMPNWEQSYGSRQEMKYAKKHGIKILKI